MERPGYFGSRAVSHKETNLIEKRNPVPHYITYAFSLVLGITMVGFAWDFTQPNKPWWHVLVAVIVVTWAIGVLEGGIVGWHEFELNRWRFHCDLCHHDGVAKGRCEFTGNNEKFLTQLAHNHRENVHHIPLPEDCS